jgi:rod shape-determining protein MreC
MKGVKNFSINKKNRNWLRYVIGASVVLFFLFVFNFFIAPISNFFYTVSSPIQKTFWTAGESSAGFFGSFFQSGNLVKQNKDLTESNQRLLAQVASLQSIEQGNLAQSDVSASCQNTGFKVVMAGVIGLDDNDILSINKGSADGIAEGMPIISQHNVLFGKISKVYKNFSKIMLISNKNNVTNVKVQQSDLTKPEIDGVIRGDGGLTAHLDLIPIDSEINPGDALFTSSVEKSFPKDLLVAKITQKIKNDQKPFQQAQISLFFNVKTTDNLFVITNYKKAD